MNIGDVTYPVAVCCRRGRGLRTKHHAERDTTAYWRCRAGWCPAPEWLVLHLVQEVGPIPYTRLVMTQFPLKCTKFVTTIAKGSVGASKHNILTPLPENSVSGTRICDKSTQNSTYSPFCNVIKYRIFCSQIHMATWGRSEEFELWMSLAKTPLWYENPELISYTVRVKGLNTFLVKAVLPYCCPAPDQFNTDKTSDKVANCKFQIFMNEINSIFCW